MKILFVSPFFPLPANTGGYVRVYQILKGLHQRHAVTFVSPVDFNKVGAREIQKIDSVCQNKILVTAAASRRNALSSVLSVRPFHVNKLYERGLKEKLSSLDWKDYDLIYLNFSLLCLPYIPAGHTPPIFLDTQNVDREIWRNKVQYARNLMWRVFNYQNLVKTTFYEKKYLKKISGYVSVSDYDRRLTQAYAQKYVHHFLVAPNGVDLSAFAVKENELSQDKITLGFMGAMDLELNQNAAKALIETILPALRQRFPDKVIACLIIGRNPPCQLLGYADRDPLVHFTGTVENVADYLKQVDIFIAPLSGGGGTKLRLFEAMATGLPIVGTPDLVKQVDGISQDENILIGQAENDLIDHAGHLIEDGTMARKLGLNARELATKVYAWDAITENLSHDLEEALKQS